MRVLFWSGTFLPRIRGVEIFTAELLPKYDPVELNVRRDENKRGTRR